MEANIKKYAARLEKEMKNCIIPIQLKSSSPSKISLKENCAFSLPPGPSFSCPGATKSCKNCYAMKGRFIFPSVVKLMTNNWKIIQKAEKSDNKRTLYRALKKVVPKNIQIYRLNESGDFFSQDYIDAWTRVIRKRPGSLFYAYTRSFNFNYQKLVRLPNFNLLASTDKYNEKEAQKFIKRYKNSNIKQAFGPWRKGWELPKNSFICPAVSKKIKVSGACEKCKLCVIKQRMKKNVVFLKH